MREESPTTPRKISYSAALCDGMAQALSEDSRVIVVGEGVPDPKSIFETTRGLRERFGPTRVFDSPLSENGMTGICVGAALSGLRPVMVHQRIDFALLAMDQIVNNAAKWRYMFGGQVTVPLVIRVIVGRGWGAGPQHSQSLQAMFAHVPGLKVVMPVSARDAKGMLLAAIRDDNPVIFIEHRWLQGIVDYVPEEAYVTPLDRALICRPGRDVTVVAFSYMVIEALLAAEALSEFGIDVEVIDARSVRPLDTATFAASVCRTGALVVADTAWKTGGIAGEVVAGIAEDPQAFKALRHPPLRIALPDLPVPTSPHLTQGFYPEALHMARAIAGHLGRSVDDAVLSQRLTRKSPHDVPQKDFTGPF